MKYLVLVLAIVLLAFPGISFSAFPQERILDDERALGDGPVLSDEEEGEVQVELNPGPVFLEDPEVTTNIKAWGWRNGGTVWVELQKTSGGFGTDVIVGKNHIEIVQDGEVYTGACLAFEKYEECGSFKIAPANANVDGRFFFRVDDTLSDDGSFSWDIKKSFNIYYKEDAGSYIHIINADPIEITVVAEPEAGGTITGAGIHEEGETVLLSAIPATGYRFSHWGDDSADDEAEKAYAMPVYRDNDDENNEVVEVEEVVAHFVPHSDSDSSDNPFDGGCFIDAFGF